jgi:hypothetical protein
MKKPSLTIFSETSKNFLRGLSRGSRNKFDFEGSIAITAPADFATYDLSYALQHSVIPTSARSPIGRKTVKKFCNSDRDCHSDDFL